MYASVLLVSALTVGQAGGYYESPTSYCQSSTYYAEVQYPGFKMRVPIVNGIAPRLIPRVSCNGMTTYDYDYCNGVPYRQQTTYRAPPRVTESREINITETREPARKMPRVESVEYYRAPPRVFETVEYDPPPRNYETERHLRELREEIARLKEDLKRMSERRQQVPQPESRPDTRPKAPKVEEKKEPPVKKEKLPDGMRRPSEVGSPKG